VISLGHLLAELFTKKTFDLYRQKTTPPPQKKRQQQQQQQQQQINKHNKKMSSEMFEVSNRVFWSNEKRPRTALSHEL